MPGRKIIIDCDPGTDDAIALLLAFASPELDVRLVTAVGGNVGLSYTLANATALVALAGAATPVIAGADRPLLGSFTAEERVHGQNGLGNVRLPPGPPATPGLAADAGARHILAATTTRPGPRADAGFDPGPRSPGRPRRLHRRNTRGYRQYEGKAASYCLRQYATVNIRPTMAIWATRRYEGRRWRRSPSRRGMRGDGGGREKSPSRLPLRAVRRGGGRGSSRDRIPAAAAAQDLSRQRDRSPPTGFAQQNSRTGGPRSKL